MHTYTHNTHLSKSGLGVKYVVKLFKYRYKYSKIWNTKYHVAGNIGGN